jgi:short-subunit dehydrogenase
MQLSNVRGLTALVTGASSGLGVSFAKHLAANGANLVLVARRGPRLESLAAELSREHGIRVDTIVADLSEPGASQKIFAQTEGAGRAVDVLLNNAGSGIHGEFLDIPWDDSARQLQLNVVALTELTHVFARPMRARGRGWVLNVSSIGAYTPSPSYATYAAGKAYVRDFTEAVSYELRNTPVRVCSLCPGGTLTEFHLASGHSLPAFMRATFMTSDRCAAIGLSALFRGRRNVVAGVANKLAMFWTRFVPRYLILVISAVTMGKPRPRELSALQTSK